MKTCTSRNIDIQYWQNTPNRNILNRYNKTVSHERKTHICTNMGFRSITLSMLAGFFVSSVGNSTSYPYGFASRYVGYTLQNLGPLSVQVIPQ